MKAVNRSRFGFAMLFILGSLAGCCSSLGTGGGKPSTTYIVVPAGQPIPGQNGQPLPGAVQTSH